MRQPLVDLVPDATPLAVSLTLWGHLQHRVFLFVFLKDRVARG